jgi:small conductance mechanosensitive channel
MAKRLNSLLRICAGLTLLISSFLATPSCAQAIPGLPPLGTGAEASQDATPSPRTRELIELLKDDEARNQLIAELEEQSREAGGDTEQPSQPQLQKPILSVMLSSIKTWIDDEIPAFIARLKRVPTTLGLAERGITTKEIEPSLQNGIFLALVCYSLFYGLRLLLRPITGRLNASGENAAWMKLFGLRLLATLTSLAPLVLALVGGFFFAVYHSAGSEEFEPGVLNFLRSFYYVEIARVIVRFLISYNRPNLRLISLPDRAARTLQRTSYLVIMFIGYGQLFLVPVVEEATSIFVARAVSTLIGAIGVLIILGVVLMNRKRVAAWLREQVAGSPFEELLDRSIDRWHYPIVIYLTFLFIVVLTNPGNVLLPLLWTSSLAIATLLIGLILIEMLERVGSQSIRLPKFVSYRLPMLESRLNRMVPTLLNIARVIVVVAGLAVISDIIGLLDLGTFFTSEYGEWALSALASAFLIIVMLYIAYIVMASWVDYKLNPFVGEVPTARTVTLLTLLRNAIAVTLFVVGVMVVLAELGMNIGPLLASAGVLGLAFSFGAQKMVEDIITGIFIQFENAMNVGDVVNVGGVIGTVEKLTVRSVTLRDLQGVVHMIPFSSAAMVSNYMREFSYYVCDMGVAYREDIGEVKQAMIDAFEELRADPEYGKFLLEDIEWMGLNEFGASEIIVRARLKTVPGEQWGVKRAYNVYLKQIFDARNIEIPFPHQTVYFGEDKKGNAPVARVLVEKEETPGEIEVSGRDDPPEPKS